MKRPVFHGSGNASNLARYFSDFILYGPTGGGFFPWRVRFKNLMLSYPPSYFLKKQKNPPAISFFGDRIFFLFSPGVSASTKRHVGFSFMSGRGFITPLIHWNLRIWWWSLSTPMTFLPVAWANFWKATKNPPQRLDWVGIFSGDGTWSLSELGEVYDYFCSFHFFGWFLPTDSDPLSPKKSDVLRWRRHEVLFWRSLTTSFWFSNIFWCMFFFFFTLGYESQMAIESLHGTFCVFHSVVYFV